MNSSGHPFGPGPVATISEKSPRADKWRTIFGGLAAPIKSAVPQRCEIARSVSLVYWLDIGRIDSETMDRLVAHAQAQSAGVVPHEQVRLLLVAEGMPIHYDEVSIITDEHPETIIAGIEAEIEKATQMDARAGSSTSKESDTWAEYEREFAERNRMFNDHVKTIAEADKARSFEENVNELPNIHHELSTGDGLPPTLCSCLTDGTPRGPHCVHARAWALRQDDGMQRVRKHGGAHTCPRACIECVGSAHHFCEVDTQPVFALDMSDEELADLDEDEREEIAMLRKHPAHLAGCEAWYECRHCDAWIEASDDDYGLDSDDFDDDDADEDCDDEEDSSRNEPDPHPGSQDVSSMIPSNDAQQALFVMLEPPARRSSIPRWASELARDLLNTTRFLGLIAVRVPTNVQFQWAPVIADWPTEVQASVHAWLNTPQESAQAAKDNVPTAVRALVDQANGTDGGEL